MTCIFLKKRYNIVCSAPVAQLDRVFGYEPNGWGFDSLRVRQKKGGKVFLPPFLHVFVYLDSFCAFSLKIELSQQYDLSSFFLLSFLEFGSL